MISKFPHVLAFRLSLALAIPALLPSCQKKPADPASNAVSAEKTNAIASELRSLELEEEKLRREIEVERLAMEREELRIQREELASKSSRLTAEELELQRKKTALAEERADDLANKARSAAQNTTRPSSSSALRAEPVSPGGSTYQRPVSVSTNDYDYSVFYNRLSSHGRWFESPQYGYIWQPSLARSANDWRPYTHGSWAYSDLGWTWVSTEPFGWATYHYGRWVLLRNVGWCWVPGNEWAPAWVCWKSSGNYVGWAPLPPESLYWRGNDWNSYYGAPSGISPRCFTFVRSNTFGSNVYQSVFSSVECVRIYQQTQYIGGYQWTNNRAHCNGVDYTRISKIVGRPLPRYECNLDTRLPSSFDPITYVNRRGNVLNIQAPSMSAPWNGALRPRAVERRLNDESVIREKTIAPEVIRQFTSSRLRDREQAETSFRTGLAQKMNQRIELQEKINAQRVELAEAVAVSTPELENSPANPDAVSGNIEPPANLTPRDDQGAPATRPGPPRQVADESIRNQAGAEMPQDDEPAARPTLGNLRDDDRRGSAGGLRNSQRQQAQAAEEPATSIGTDSETMREKMRLQQERALIQQQEREQQLAANELLQQKREVEQQEQTDAAEQAAMQEQQEQAQLQESQQAQAAEQQRAEQMKSQQAEQEAATMREQQAAEQSAAQREAAEQAQMQQQQEAEARAIIEQQQRDEQMQAEQQQAAMREQQAAAEAQAQQEAQMRRQQEEAEQMRQQQEQQEQMRQQQEEAMREQQQQEQMRQQQEEAARQQQEEMRQQQQEQMRQQQEEAARQQQEEMRQQQQEQMRQQQEEAARQQQEAARQQQEEAARQQQGQ